MRTTILLVILLFSNPIFSQVKFEEGFFFDNSNQKIECLIKNEGWRFNPESIDIKTSPTGDIQEKSISEITGFGIGEDIMFKRFTVDIDRSSQQLDKLSKKRIPDFSSETLFLKLISEGDANLYQYKAPLITRYFYEQEGRSIEQLIYKKYLVNNSVAENLQFIEQLSNNVNCTGKIISTNFKYNYNTLSNHFNDHNRCINPEIKTQTSSSVKYFNLRPNTGINFSSTEITSSMFGDTDFGSLTKPRIGLEMEFILPFNNDKWALLLDPNYQSFEGEEQVGSRNAELTYSSIEIPVMARYYFFLDEKSKLFLNGGIPVSFDSSSLLDFSSGVDLEGNTNLVPIFGAGYDYNDKLAIEVRTHPSKSIIVPNNIFGSDYNLIATILKYNIF